MWRMCQYLHEDSAWQRWPFILMEFFMKQNKWSMVVPIKVWYTPGHLTDVKNEWLIHSVAVTPLTQCLVVKLWSWWFWHCLQSPNPRFQSQVYRYLLRNSGGRYLVFYFCRQPINAPKYSLSKECRQLNISVEGPFFITENSCSICKFSAFQSANSCTPKQINLVCCLTNKKLSWVAAVPCTTTVLCSRT